MKRKEKIEFWADSFHEGCWACDQLSKAYRRKSINYEKGFIPISVFEVSSEVDLEIAVLGSYKNWSPIPQPIKDLIEWGKPDIIAYDPQKDTILFAMEETAAVPTGNQALQRCERVFGSSRLKIPFWYLISEYGVHANGGIRRDSIWPTVLAIKLSGINRTPCVVLHYSDRAHPEDYSAGQGVNSLFKALTTKMEVSLGIRSIKSLTSILNEQYRHMIEFINSQCDRVVNFIPKKELLSDPTTPGKIAKLVTSQKVDASVLDFFNWGRTSTLPQDLYETLEPGGVIRKDDFILQFEDLVGKKRGYNLSSRAGSRPQHKSKVLHWIEQQKALLEGSELNSIEFSMNIEEFPVSPTGLVHITSAKNVFYLLDYWKDVEKSLKKVFHRLKRFRFEIKKDIPVFLYISNSLRPGRIFGDPYTGQLSVFANVFTKNILGDRTRLSIAYYPLQVHAQLFDNESQFRGNKGIMIMRELLDYAIFHGGVLVNMKTGEVI